MEERLDWTAILGCGRANTPAGEMSQAAGEAIGSYFRTHPPSDERARRLNEMAAGRRGEYYVGKENLKDRVARGRKEYPGEKQISHR